MKLRNPFILGLLALVFCLATTSCSYNDMVEKQQDVDQAWGNVENQYQRRNDLIPNLVNTVKGYSAHESETLEAVTNARAGLTKAYNDANTLSGSAAQDDIAGFQQAQDKLKGALNVYVNAVKEAYPDLKANTNFLDLQAQLEGTENRIATERTRYNDAVKEYNVLILRFPNNIYAGWFNFKKRDMFKAEPGAQSAPQVQF